MSYATDTEERDVQQRAENPNGLLYKNDNRIENIYF